MAAEMGISNDGRRIIIITHTVCERQWRMQSVRQPGDIDGRQDMGSSQTGQTGPSLSNRPVQV